MAGIIVRANLTTASTCLTGVSWQVTVKTSAAVKSPGFIVGVVRVIVKKLATKGS